ncbi:MAG: hypothetical protein ACRDFZ_02900 [Candidatus Limnocylindria bacterium]
MSNELETVLRLVAEGKLTPEEAAPIVAALTDRAAASAGPGQGQSVRREAGAGARQLRVRVEEQGRTVVNLRVPLSFAETALNMVPGLAGEQAERVRAALQGGAIGPIIDVEDPDGDAVLISLE